MSEIIEIYEKRLNGTLDRFPYCYWTDKNTIKVVVKYILEDKLNYSREEIADNFSIKFIMKYKLWGLMQYFRGSPYELLNFVYPGEYLQWELKNVPMNTWNLETAKEALRWLIEKKLKWNKDDVMEKYSKAVFLENGLNGLLHFFDSSPYRALNLAYPGKYLPWELKKVPMDTWNDVSCRTAVKWLFEKKLGWNEDEIRSYATKRIFNENRLGGLLRSYSDSVIRLLNIAYPGKFTSGELMHKKK